MLRRIIATVIVAGAALVGLGALATPAQAASSKGTVTQAEAKTLTKQMNKQRCLTAKEAKKIVHGSGHTTKYRYTDISWKGAKHTYFNTVTVTIIKGCTKAVTIEADYSTETYRKGHKNPSVEMFGGF